MKKIKEVFEFEEPYAGRDERISVSAYLVIDWKNSYVVLSCPKTGKEANRHTACIKASASAKDYANNAGIVINEYISHED